jgi:uncharacterized protein (TIGR02145 family)
MIYTFPLYRKLCYCAFGAVAILSSCVNTLTEDASDSGIIPVNLSTSIQTRVLNNQYEDADMIGVFLLSKDQSLSTDRFLDNEPFFAKSGKPQSDKTIYYPAGNSACTFISYYPYNKASLASGDSKMMVSVAANQESVSDYSTSDFLVAKTEGVVPSTQTVSLIHSHRFSLLNIVIQPEAGSSTDELLKANPTVTVTNVYTQCKYNLETGEISDLSNMQVVVPHGKWSVSDGKLVGLSVILVPQTIKDGTLLFNLNIDGKTYQCSVKGDFELMSKKNNVLTIPCSKFNVGFPTISISDWEKGAEGTTVLDQMNDGMVLSSLSFAKSNVLNVYNGQTEVAKICKEYLLADNLEAQAIVIYPVVKGTVDLKSGKVLRFLNNQDPVGGTVTWNDETNKLTYVKGNVSNLSVVYFDENHSISFAKPTKSQAVRTSPDLLTDVRGGESMEYPVVKIATQFWMGADLETAYYKDGTLLPVRTSYSTGNTEAGSYVIQDKAVHFYNAAIVNSGKMIPNGWTLPDESDWKLMLNYIGENNVNRLRTGTWEPDTYGASNETYFGCTAKGCVMVKKEEDLNKGVYVNSTNATIYWCSKNTEGVNRGAAVWSKVANVVYVNQKDDLDCSSIRCIRK